MTTTATIAEILLTDPVDVATQNQPDDPDIVPFEDDHLPELDPDVLPDWAGRMAVELSTAKEVSPTMAVLLELATIASCVQRKHYLHVEGSYFETLSIYAAPALESGERKTAIQGPIVKPLFVLQKELREHARTEQQAVTVRRKLMESQIKRLERDYLNANPCEQPDIQQQIVELTARLPQVPALPQIVCEDFTEAALSVAMGANGESLLVTSDEGGLFDNLSGRHNDCSEIDLFLKSHNGSPHSANRVGRENVLLTRPLLSVAISPQPAVLSCLARKEGFMTRGLTARFLWGLPTSRVGHRSLRALTIDRSILETYDDHIIRMARAGRDHVGRPGMLSLSNEAHSLWKDFERELEPRLASDGDLRSIKPWASKLAGAVARIAAVCHCADHMDNAGLNPVNRRQMGLAVEVGRQLIPHAIAAHRLMGGGGITTALAVVRHYERAGWPTTGQSMTDWWRPVRRIVGETSSDFEPVAKGLMDHGYLLPVESPRGHGACFRANGKLLPRVAGR